jgi:hypothetical protein
MSEVIRRLLSPSIEPGSPEAQGFVDDFLAQMLGDGKLSVPSGASALPMPRDPFATLMLDDVMEANAGSTAPLTQHVFGLDPDAPNGPIIPMGELKTIEDFNTNAPRPSQQAGFGPLPARGTEVAIVDPHLALRQMYYDKLGLGDEVQKRMDSGAGVMNPRREYTDGVTLGPYEATPWLETQIRNDGYSYAEGVGGYHHMPKIGRFSPADRMIEVAAHGRDPKGTAAHEMRHAITKDSVFEAEPFAGVQNAATESGPAGAEFQQESGIDRPTEVLAYSAEAIPLFAETHGRLPTTDADADEAMRLISERKGDSKGQMHLLNKAYQNDPATKDFIRTVMKTGYAVAPAAAAAGVAGTADAEEITDPRFRRVMAESRAIKNFQDPNGIRTESWSPDDEETKTAGYDRWSRMAPEIMAEPVISSRYMADQLGIPPQMAQDVFGDRISMSDYITAVTRMSEIGALEERLRENGFPEEKIPAMVQAQSEHFGPQWAQQADGARAALISGKGTDGQIALAKQARAAVYQHTPRGEYAQYAGRSPEEAAQASSQFGQSADFNLTPAGQQNYGAQRVHEFMSASQPDYEPATGWGQAARIAGGVLSPMQRGIQAMTMGNAKNPVDEQGNNAYLDPFRDAARIASPGGKFDFAADLAEQSKGASNVYDEQGRANFLMNSALTPSGFGNAYMNASYPVGYGVNALFGNKQLGDFAGIAMGQGLGSAVDDFSAARAIRTQGNRVTPITIPGMSDEQMQTATRQMEANDAGSDAYVSASLGPVLSDAMGVERSYLSPVGSGFFNILGELASDPVNVGYNVAFPGIGAAASTASNIAKSGGKTIIPHLAKGVKDYGKGVGKAVANLRGDMVDEGLVEPIQFGAPTVGIDGLFQPQTSNALIDNFGNGIAPNEEGYDPMGANTERVVQRLQTTQPVTEARKRTRGQPAAMDYQRPPAGGKAQF